MAHEFEIPVLHQMGYVVFFAGIKIVYTKHFMALLQQFLTKMRAKETSPSSNKDALHDHQSPTVLEGHSYGYDLCKGHHCCHYKNFPFIEKYHIRTATSVESKILIRKIRQIYELDRKLNRKARYIADNERCLMPIHQLSAILKPP